MTVLGGARPLPGAVLPRAASPRARRPANSMPRRRVSRSARSAPRTGLVRQLIGVVLVAFLVGLIYVAHTVHLAATTYETDQLVLQQDDLLRQIQTVETSVLRWGAEPTVVERAHQLGLDQLSPRVRLSAR